MRFITHLFLLLQVAAASACSCFGPETFCGTLNPPYPEPQWWTPDAIILGKKVAAVGHGMDVQVIETLQGEPAEGSVIRVWGDCGLLCRIYPDAWQIGDTVVWALKYTDLAGNSLCGTSLEQEGDYMISVCGTYYLNYQNGIVTGPITAGVNSLPYSELMQYIESCGTTSINGPEEHVEVRAYMSGEDLIIGSNTIGMGYTLHDAQGRLVHTGKINSTRTVIGAGRLASGVHLLRYGTAKHSGILRIVVP